MSAWKGKIAGLLIALAICGMMSSFPVFATQFAIDEVKEQLDALEESRENSRQELEKLEEEGAYLEGRLAELNQSLRNVTAELTELQQQLSDKEEEIAVAKEELQIARQEEKTQYENMKLRIRFLYEQGNTSILEALLGAESFADFVNLGVYIESVQEYDRKMLGEYRQIKEDVEARERSLEDDQALLLALVDEQEQKKQEVSELLAEVQRQNEVMQQQIAEKGNAVAAIDAQIEQQLAYEAELERQKAEEDARRLEEIAQQEQENTGDAVISDSPDDIALLAALIECEADGESYEGKLAVGSVVLNRVRSAYFPNTIAGVIYQSGQFSPVASGRFATVLARGANATCVQAAQENLSGTITVNCLYFRRNNGTIDGIVIGNHVFY